MTQFRGLFPAMITPFTATDELNEEGLRQSLEFNIQAGVHGFWLAGGTGECVFLTDEENKRVADIAADQNRGRVANIMHVGAPTTARTIALAEHAAGVGMESICCVPPFFYVPSDDQVVEYYKAVGAAADLPLFIYNLPQATGVEITPDLLKQLQDQVPQLQGLKHSAANFHNARIFAEMGVDCFIGSSALKLPGLTVGCCGCVDGPPTCAPEAWVEVWDAYQAGDLRRAQEAQRKAIEIFNVLVNFKYFAAIKVGVGVRVGSDMGDPRQPNQPMTEAEKDQLQERFEALNLGPVTVAV